MKIDNVRDWHSISGFCHFDVLIAGDWIDSVELEENYPQLYADALIEANDIAMQLLRINDRYPDE